MTVDNTVTLILSKSEVKYWTAGAFKSTDEYSFFAKYTAPAQMNSKQPPLFNLVMLSF